MYFGWWIVGTYFVVQVFMIGFHTYGWPLLVPVVAADLEADLVTMNLALTLGGCSGSGCRWWWGRWSIAGPSAGSC
ncbi:MAG: hypothetical protein R3E53_10270 [Myxococcota bacterium]